MAFGLYNHGSLSLAVEKRTPINNKGYTWIAVVSGVILTTMQVQDLKDQAGDRQRGRRTVPLLLGESFSRWSIAMCVPIWSAFCVTFWKFQQPLIYGLTIFSGAIVAVRAVTQRTPQDDCHTWRLWCAWLMILCALPLLPQIVREKDGS